VGVVGPPGPNLCKGRPSVEKLTAFNEPRPSSRSGLRGLSSAKDITSTAELAARELQRTGGLQRAVVAVGTTTGTG